MIRRMAILGQVKTSLVKSFVASSFQQERLGKHKTVLALHRHVRMGLCKLREGRTC